MKYRITLFFLLISVSVSFSQKYKSGPQIMAFHSLVDDTDQPYALYLPPSFDENREYPFVVMLHGAGSNHRLALRRVFGKSNLPGENDVDASRLFPKWEDVDYIVAAPLSRGTMGYQGVAERDVWDMIADVKDKFKIDENRTYLTGLSMGGGGTLWIGLTRPDFWAAIAPVCPAPPRETVEYKGNAFHLPTHFFQGEIDPVVPITMVNQWVEDFKNTGTHVEYTVYPHVQHNSWENAYANGNIFKWFSKYERNPSPERVHFTTASLKHNKAFWLEVLAIAPGKIGKIDAQLEKEKIIVSTDNIEAFRILKNVPIDKSTKPEVIVNGVKLSDSDRAIVLGDMEATDSFAKVNGQGPMVEVVADRHIYVYGTLDNPEAKELERRKNLAIEAADWSFYRGEFLGRAMVFPRVMADKDLSETDIKSSNLVLFGTDETNRIIAKYKEALPFKFTGDTTQSLSYVFPTEKRLLLINSGFPFWEIPDEGDNFLRILKDPSKATILKEYGDWVFSDKNENSTVFGYFDNHWRLSEESKKLLSGKRGLELSE